MVVSNPAFRNCHGTVNENAFGESPATIPVAAQRQGSAMLNPRKRLEASRRVQENIAGQSS